MRVMTMEQVNLLHENYSALASAIQAVGGSVGMVLSDNREFLETLSCNGLGMKFTIQKMEGK